MAETYVTLSSLKHYDEKIKEVIDEKQDQLVGTEGQVVSFDADGNVIAVDAPNGGGEEPTLVSFVYESTDNNTWTVHSVDKTYDEIKTALSENKRVIAKGTNKNARLDNPWYFYPNEYYDSAGNWVVFERVNVNGSSAIEAFKLTVNGDGTATLVETEVSQIDLSNCVEKEEGKGLSTNDLTDELLETIETGDAKTVNGHTVESNVPENAKFTDTVTTVTTTGSGNAITSISSTDGVVTATKGSTFLTAHPTISKSTDTTSTATATHGGTITMVDSVTRDGNGHVTKINTKTVTLPSDADTKYTHPTTSGNKHIPSGGSSGQILRWSADGTAVWGADNNTTYSNFVKSGSGAKAGLVPAPSTTEGTTKYLREDGTWAVPPDTNTTYTHPTSGVTAGTYRSVTVNAQGHVTAGTNPTITLAQGGTGATDASTARTNLGVPPTSHASTGTTYGKGTTSNYGHLKINDSYSSTPSTSYNASNGVAASLYGVQQLNSKYERLEERVTELDGGDYTLVGKMSFGIGTSTINISTVITKTNVGGTLPFTVASNDSNRVQYFTTSSNTTYYYKYVKASSGYMTVLVEGAGAPSASSIPQVTNMMSATYAVNSDTMLDTIDYGTLSFKTGKYYYGCYNATTTVNRGGVLYLYTKN